MHCQPLVPSISAGDGQWLISKPLTLVCKPGGHGVIWKLAHDKGIFRWFSGHGRKGATVRQVRLSLCSIYKLLNRFNCGVANLGHIGVTCYFVVVVVVVTSVMLWLLRI